MSTTRKKQLSDMEKAFIEHLMTDAKGNPRAALALAGYSPHTKVSEVVNALRDEIIEAAKDVLTLNAPKAALAMAQALDDGTAAGASNILKAAQQVLDRVGVATKADSVDLKVPSGGLVIMPAKKGKKQEDEDDNES